MGSKMWNGYVITIFALIITLGIVVFSSKQENSSKNLVEFSDNNTVVDETMDSNTAVVDLTENNKAVLEQLNSIDFMTKRSGIKVTAKEDMQYRVGYFKVLQNEIPIMDEAGEEIYYKDLWRAGIDVAELWENRSETNFPYELYYKDLDGDKKPELAINQGCFYIFKYDLEEKVCRILYSEQSCYFGGILGEGQLWYNDGLHANVIRNRYIVFNGRNEWETVLDLEEGLGCSGHPDYFRVGTVETESVMVDKDTWKLVTEPFFKMTENLMEPQNYEEFLSEIIGSANLDKDSSTDSELPAREFYNTYFFSNADTYQFNGRFSALSAPSEEKEVDLIVTEIRDYKEGILYELKINANEEIQDRYRSDRYGMDRLNLGCFFVQEDKIYLIREDAVRVERMTAEELVGHGTLVCQEEEKADILGPDEKGWHEYISVDGNRREYHGYNDLIATGFYEHFVWEMGKGLVAYKSGYGAEMDDMELSSMRN